MVPFVLLHIQPDILDLFALIIRWRQIVQRRLSNTNTQFLEIMNISSSFLKLFLMWFELVQLIKSFLKMKLAKKFLLKPHLLIQRLQVNLTIIQSILDLF